MRCPDSFRIATSRSANLDSGSGARRRDIGSLRIGRKSMTDRVLVVAPHPDDETLGCGGTLLRRARAGSQIAWLIVTSMSENDGFSAESMSEGETEIAKVREAY